MCEVFFKRGGGWYYLTYLDLLSYFLILTQIYFLLADILDITWYTYLRIIFIEAKISITHFVRLSCRLFLRVSLLKLQMKVVGVLGLQIKTMLGYIDRIDSWSFRTLIDRSNFRCIVSCPMIGQGARDEMIAAFTIIVTVSDSYFTFYTHKS